MEKINFKYIYGRTKLFLLKPEAAWRAAVDEDLTEKELFRSYLVPLAALTSIVVLAFSFLEYKPFQAVGCGITNLLSATAGTWLAYLITREYLNNKCSNATNVALKLTVYSAAIYIFFQGLGTAFGDGFFGQIFSLAGFIFVRTLYVGINQVDDLQPNNKTNVLIITGLSIACIPVIINHILMILLGIPAINV